MSPYMCPVCWGRGKVDYPPGTPITLVIEWGAIWDCAACDGTGIVWGPPEDGDESGDPEPRVLPPDITPWIVWNGETTVQTGSATAPAVTLDLTEVPVVAPKKRKPRKA